MKSFSGIKYIILFLLFMFVNSHILLAQESLQLVTVKLSGKVLSDHFQVDGATVSLYNGLDLENKRMTNISGSFDFELNPHYDYRIIVSKSGYLDKEIKVRSEMVLNLKNMKTFEFSIELTPLVDIAQN